MQTTHRRVKMISGKKIRHSLTLMSQEVKLRQQCKCNDVYKYSQSSVDLSQHGQSAKGVDSQ